MSLANRARSVYLALTDVFGFKINDKITIEKRIRQVTAVSIVGALFGFVFSMFNYFMPQMEQLSFIELVTVVLLLLACLIGRRASSVGIAEDMVIFTAFCTLLALIIFGGIQGTGLFWVYTAPFLAFFLKGQRLGWWYSLAFLAAVTLYFVSSDLFSPYAYDYSPTVIAQFIVSLSFYTLIAASVNHLRTRFEEQLQKQVSIKTADSQQLLEQLQFLASHDHITQLPNKVMLIDMLNKQINEIKVSEQLLVVCTLKLERMFETSTILGSAGADQLVLKIAEYLERFTLVKGALAHTHRDEFVITYPANRATFNPEELHLFFSERQISVEVQGHFIYCDVTLGLAMYPDHDTNPQALLNKAQQAMLQAHQKRQQWLIYDSKQEKAFVRHHLLFGKLRAALTQQHLHVHFQPQIDLVTGLVIGAEALIRWHDPVEGFIAPCEFIPVAEESGLILPLTHWLLDVCMQERALWRKQKFDVPMSINLSTRNLLDPELLHVLRASLRKYNLSPTDITLEITESCFMSSPDRAMEVIRRLHEIGFRLSIDDFGTGYSSLCYIKHLPIDELKLDQSFVRKLLHNSGDQAIVSSTIDLAHNFDLQIVAEGIEDEQTGHWLQARGCDIGQGYFYAKPMPSEEFVAFLFANLAKYKRTTKMNENSASSGPSGRI